MPALIYFVGVVSDLGALICVRGADYLSVFDKPQRDALAMLFLQLRDRQNTAAEILWGLWLIPLAILTYKSRFLPRFLGVWLGYQRARLHRPQLHGCPVSAVPGCRVHVLPARDVWRAGVHAVARSQRRKADGAGSRKHIAERHLGRTAIYNAGSAASLSSKCFVSPMKQGRKRTGVRPGYRILGMGSSRFSSWSVKIPNFQ